MKIGILTFHRAINYGAVLQCYALKETLRGMGNDVEIIDYRPECIEKERWAFYWNAFKTKTWKQKTKYLLLTPFKYYSKHKASKSFNAFMQRRFKFSCRVRTAADIPKDYDIIVFGSDQIWSPIICNGFNPIYYGQIEKGKSRFISYAASLEGYEQFTCEQWKLISEKMKNFDAISVREQSFQKELTQHTGKLIEWVVDPTLLISPILLKDIAIHPPYCRYIFLFTVQAGNQPYHIAKQIAAERGCIVVRARSCDRMNLQNREMGVENLSAVSPEMFIGLINHAECVVTNSFHATVISLQLKKDFYAVESLHPSRIIDILNTVGLLDRYVTQSGGVKTNVAPIDYDKIHAMLNDLVSMSNRYLMKNLQNK